jgi:hypothetical protein
MGRNEAAFLEDAGKWAAYPHHRNYKRYLPIIKKNSKDSTGALMFILWCFSEEVSLLTQL